LLLKPKILVKNRSFVQKSKFWSQIKIWAKIKVLVQNENFSQQNKNLVKNPIFCQKKEKKWSKNSNFGQKQN